MADRNNAQEEEIPNISATWRAFIQGHGIIEGILPPLRQGHFHDTEIRAVHGNEYRSDFMSYIVPDEELGEGIFGREEDQPRDWFAGLRLCIVKIIPLLRLLFLVEHDRTEECVGLVKAVFSAIISIIDQLCV